jgi:hypothetical protein
MSCQFFGRDKCFKCPAVTAVLFKWRQKSVISQTASTRKSSTRRRSQSTYLWRYETSVAVTCSIANTHNQKVRNLHLHEIIISAFIRKNNNEWSAATASNDANLSLISFNCFLFGFTFGFTYFYFIRIYLFFLMDFLFLIVSFRHPGGLSAIASSFVTRWRNYH